MHFFTSILGFLAMALFVACASTAHAQTAAEAAAAKETYIENLRIYPPSDALKQRQMQIVYVENDTRPGGGRYFCGGMNSKQIKQAATIADAVLQKIPVSAWNKIDLKYLLLCSDTSANGRAIGGIPVPPIKLLMLAAGNNPSTTSRYPYTILHELYHAIEMQKGAYNDSEWGQQFSGYDNSYGSSAGSTALGTGGKGFVNGYGKSFPYEERAELFTISILAGATLDSFIAKQNDSTLKAKRDFMRKKCTTLLGNGVC